MLKKTEAGKRADHYGKGSKENYLPWIRVGEFGSQGTSACCVDWKTGRTVHCLSQAEEMVWYLLRWDDENLDIREQYPLDLDETLAIADELGLTHPAAKGTPKTMTTDFLITRTDREIAISVKSSESQIKKSRRAIEKLYIEKEFWRRKNISFKLLTKDRMNMDMFLNIRNVVPFYEADILTDDISIAKHLIAQHLIDVDMSHPLNFPEIVIKERKVIDLWKIHSK